MSSIFKRIARRLDAADYYIDAQFRRLRRRYRPSPVQIIPFDGHGTPQTLYFGGRLLEGAAITKAQESDELWDNLRAMYQRILTREVPRALVYADFAGGRLETETDQEGYYNFELHLAAPLDTAAEPWQQVELTVPVQPGVVEPVVETGRVLVPTPAAEFGVISDIDDTILQTFATSWIKMTLTILMNNARTRLPFPGIAAFYQALQRGGAGNAFNPFFYISSSPWNMYDLLGDFMDLNAIPRGPLFLQDFGIDENKFFAGGHSSHKMAQIRRVLTTHGRLPFILVGDSGQHDPEIYLEAVESFPGRIQAVYIRDVSDDVRRSSVQAIIARAAELGVPMLLVPDSDAAAAHAAGFGWVAPASLPAVAENVEQDKGPAQKIEEAIEEVAEEVGKEVRERVSDADDTRPETGPNK